MLSGDVDLELVGFERMTALHHAVSINNVEIVELLLRRGASKEATDDQDRTPLDIAREIESKKIIDLLSK